MHGEAMYQGIGAALLSVTMIAAFLLGGAGLWLIAKRGQTKKGILMLIAAFVLTGNVLIWTLPG
jgi:hypothetical protein